MTAVIAPTPIDAGTFDSDKHEYRWNGVRLISVTEALNRLIDSRWFTDEARNRGRVVHKAVHYDAECSLNEESVDPRLWGFVRAARRFRQDTKFKAIQNEQRIYIPEFGVAGTTDTYGTADDALDVIVDWKSGRVCDWTRYQLSGYSYRVGRHRQRWGVQLKEDGTYKLTVFPASTATADLKDFFCLVRARQLELQHNRGEQAK